MPEYVLPRNLKEGTQQHALFLTYVISIDYMTDAEKLWRKSRGAYELHPERLTPEQVLKVSPKSAFLSQDFLTSIEVQSMSLSLYKGV